VHIDDIGAGELSTGLLMALGSYRLIRGDERGRSREVSSSIASDVVGFIHVRIKGGS